MDTKNLRFFEKIFNLHSQLLTSLHFDMSSRIWLSNPNSQNVLSYVLCGLVYRSRNRWGERGNSQ